MGRWYGNSGPRGEGVTTGGGVVSCKTAWACRRLRRALCAGDSDACATRLWGMEIADEPGTCSATARREGDVGGVWNSSSLEVSWTGPMASGHLENHFQTAALMRAT